MKLRESGMPPQGYWETLFDVEMILDHFRFGKETGDVAELGCGFGTFTVPLARRIGGTVHTFDIDPEMVGATARRTGEIGLDNVHVSQRDIFASGFGLPNGSCTACLLFNILHCEEPVALLRAARHVIVSGGLVAVIHWRSDITTPRGPSAAIRPLPKQIVAWAAEVGGLEAEGVDFLLPPWHLGLRLRRFD